MKPNLLGRFQFLCWSVVVLLSLWVPAIAAGQTPVQTAFATGTIYQNSVSLTFTGAQTATNLNVVVVDWFDISATVASVTDTSGNTYVLAAGTVSTPLPTAGPGTSQSGVSQAIYYAKNIAAALAGANTVTVTFNQKNAGQDVHMAEYSGLDTVNPLDTSVGTFGSGNPADSGPGTTTSANDLIFGAGDITTGFDSFSGACGTGCTMSPVSDTHFRPAGSGLDSYNDVTESALVTAIGSYDAGATDTTQPGSWVMEMAAFRPSPGPAVGPAPTITSVTQVAPPPPAEVTEAGGTQFTIAGTNFQQGATVTFTDGTTTASAVSCTVTPTTSITCLTPVFSVKSTTPNVIVTNPDGGASTPSGTSVFPTGGFVAIGPFHNAPTGTSAILPAGGPTDGGTSVTIYGSDFAAGASVVVQPPGGGPTVPADNVEVVNSNTIQTILPAGSVGSSINVVNPSGESAPLPGAGFAFATGAGINFIQANSAQSPSAANLSVPFQLAQTKGNVNIVVVGWSDITSTLQSVKDSANNVQYTLACPVLKGSAQTQAIYYLKNIAAAAAGSNTVSVAFNASAAFVDLRVLEYNGIDLVKTVDACSTGAANAGSALDSGPVNVTNAGEMVLGASTVSGAVNAHGPNFVNVLLTMFGDNVEHSFPAAAGAVDATATQGSSGPWVMQAVSFLQSTGLVPDFTITAIPLSPSPIAPGNSATSTVTITPTNGFNSQVNLTCSVTPAAGPNPCLLNPTSVTPGSGAVTSTLTVSIPVAGTYQVTVSAVSGSTTHTTTLNLTVTTAADFSISATALSPASVSAGSPATSTVTLTSINGFNSSVTLSCTVTPSAGASPCAFNPSTATPSSSGVTSTLTVTIATPGSYQVTISGVSGATTHTTTVNLTVTAVTGSFTMAASPSSASVTAGGSTSTTITITATNGFTGTVNLACSVSTANTPAPTCSVQSSVNVTGATATATMSINTTAPHASLMRSKSIFYAMLLPMCGITLIGAGFTSRRKLVGILLLCLVIAGLVFMTACGGGSSSGGGGGGLTGGTPSGNYTFTVTGTSGALAPTTTFTLTVQ